MLNHTKQIYIRQMRLIEGENISRKLKNRSERCFRFEDEKTQYE
jgi:hypothetical protein